jgi:hypothetical protein
MPNTLNLVSVWLVYASLAIRVDASAVLLPLGLNSIAKNGAANLVHLASGQFIFGNGQAQTAAFHRYPASLIGK